MSDLFEELMKMLDDEKNDTNQHPENLDWPMFARVIIHDIDTGYYSCPCGMKYKGKKAEKRMEAHSYVCKRRKLWKIGLIRRNKE